MLECLAFIFGLVIDFLRMLFTIDIGHNMSLGLLMCIVFIFLPMVLVIVNFLKFQFIDEMDDKFDNDRYVPKHAYLGKHSKEYLRRK